MQRASVGIKGLLLKRMTILQRIPLDAHIIARHAGKCDLLAHHPRTSMRKPWQLFSSHTLPRKSFVSSTIRRISTSQPLIRFFEGARNIPPEPCQSASQSGRVYTHHYPVPKEPGGAHKHPSQLEENRVHSQQPCSPQTLTSPDSQVDVKYMQMALAEAEEGASKGEIPVGAVLTFREKVLAKAHNRVESEKDPTLHAEMICIREAAKVLTGWRLLDCTLYVTLEPCPMCAGAILQSRLKRLVWGAPNTLLGADGSWIRMFPADSADSTCGAAAASPPAHPFHPGIDVTRHVLSAESAALMRAFFRKRRLAGKGPKSDAPDSSDG